MASVKKALPAFAIDEQQAAERYGLSRSWFQRARWAGNGPPYMKLQGRVLYPLEETDCWFKAHLIRSTSEQCQTEAGSSDDG